MSNFKGRVAVITGGASGFGSESAQIFAKQGAKVVLWDIVEAQGKALAKQIREEGGIAEFIKVDVRSAEQVKNASEMVAKKYRTVDILVNSAGVHQVKTGNVVEADEEEYDRVMDTNVKGIFLSCKYIIPLMKNGGSIVNLASAWGTVVSNRVPFYCTSKAAVIHLSKAMALDFAADKIRVNSIGPGTCRTPMVEGIVAKNYAKFGFDSPDEMWESRREAHPIGRLGTAADVAHLIVFLASDEAAWMTGSSVIIDGGFTIGKSFKKGKSSGAGAK